MDAHRSSEVANARDDFFGRLTRMAILFEFLIAVRKRDLALAGIEGSLSELELLRDFDSILAGLQAECTLALTSEDSEDQERTGEDCEAGADEAGSGGATKGGDGEAVPIAGEFEDEGDAPRNV
ncbi:hypothetical protein Bca101_042612 [Brassica carinata]